MEEDNELEQNTGSPSSGESEFVHVQSIDSASIDTSSLINQDDGVVVTRVESAQDEVSDVRMTEDEGNEEFVDCPDDLVSYDGRRDFNESSEAELVLENQQIFADPTVDNRHSLFDSQKEILPHHYQEERQELMTELTNLRHQLKLLIKKHQSIEGNCVGSFNNEFTAAFPLHEMINDCSKFIELALSEQSQTDSTIRELYATIDTKDRQINDLNMKVVEVSSVETVADRIFSFFGTVFGEEFPDTSVSDKMTRIEKSSSILIQNYNRFLSGVEMLNQCLIEVKPDYRLQSDMDKVLFSVRDELVALKRKEYELAHKSSYLEIEYRKLMQQLEKSRETFKTLNLEIEKLKGEVEVQRTRFTNTKEKLNLAVTKGKSLVQQRDSLKQLIMEKTNELDKCLLELQEKSSALEAANSLNEALLQRDTVLKKCEEVLSFSGVNGDELQSLDIIDKVTWLANERSRFLESFNMAKYESIKLQDEINIMKKAARGEIDRLTVSLLMESQEKNYLQAEFADLKNKNGSLEIDLQRSEDKTILLRGKLSMAVKKGKGLVQERAEKNAQIDELKLELKQQETTVNDFKDQISKLESDLLHSKKGRDQIEQFLVESNTLLQSVIEAIDNIVVPVDLTEPVEKVKWCATYINECQVAKENTEKELGDVKDEAGSLTSKLTNALTTMKSLEDIIAQLTEEKQQLEVSKSNVEEKLHKSLEEMSSQTSKFQEIVASENVLQESLSLAENNISVLTCEKKDAEMELQKVKDEAHKTIKSLEDVMSQLQIHVSQFSNENEKAVDDKSLLENEIKNLKEEASCHEKKLINASATVITLKDALKKAEENVNNLQIDKQIQENRVVMLEHDIKVLRSACADVTKEMKFLVENNVFVKLNYNPSSVDDVAVADIKVGEEMLSAARNIRSVIEQCVDVKKNMFTTIKELQAELEITRSMSDQVKEENEKFENRVLKLETELEDYRVKEDEWGKREAELSKQVTAFMNDHEAKKDLISDSEVKSLFNKIKGITIPFPNVGKGDIDAHDSNPSKKLFYIVDSVHELLDQITLLSHSNEELHSTLSKQTLEIKYLYEELEEAVKDRKEFEKIKKELLDLSLGLENLILKFGDEKSADVAGLLPVLERLIDGIILDSENSKAKLLETEKVAEELANKVKLLEDFSQSQTEIERGATASSSLPSHSEISEIEDSVSVGKRTTPLVRTLRRESNDYLSINIDSESERLMEDKGHIFKSLHTSGLVPAQGKIVVDRLDGIWVSGGRALMSRPRARLGLIAYWLVLHLWLLGSLL